MTDDMASSVPLASKTAKFHYRTRLSQDHISDISLKWLPVKFGIIKIVIIHVPQPRKFVRVKGRRRDGIAYKIAYPWQLAYV